MTLGERSKEEPKRLMEEGLKSVSSNYLLCPSLCKICNNFSESNSTHPYKCVTGHSDHIGHKSKKENYKQYNDCRYFKEKEQSNNSNNNDKSFQNNDKVEPVKINIEKMPLKNEPIIDIDEKATCYVCGKEKNLQIHYGNHFHKSCLEEFENSEKGKKWIIDYKKYHNENAIKKIVSKYGNDFWDEHLTVKKWKAHVEIFIEFMGLKSDDYYNNLFLDVDIDEFSSFVENKYKKLKGE